MRYFDLAAPMQAFAALYTRDSAREEGELLPMAARLLGQAELDRIGAAMQHRRGIAAGFEGPPRLLADATQGVGRNDPRPRGETPA